MPSSNFKLIKSNENVNRRQVYSPTDMYDETQHNEGNNVYISLK